jgi:hypothetical protein
MHNYLQFNMFLPQKLWCLCSSAAVPPAVMASKTMNLPGPWNQICCMYHPIPCININSRTANPARQLPGKPDCSSYLWACVIPVSGIIWSVVIYWTAISDLLTTCWRSTLFCSENMSWIWLSSHSRSQVYTLLIYDQTDSYNPHLNKEPGTTTKAHLCHGHSHW